MSKSETPRCSPVSSFNFARPCLHRLREHIPLPCLLCEYLGGPRTIQDGEATTRSVRLASGGSRQPQAVGLCARAAPSLVIAFEAQTCWKAALDDIFLPGCDARASGQTRLTPF